MDIHSILATHQSKSKRPKNQSTQGNPNAEEGKEFPKSALDSGNNNEKR